MPTKAKKRGPKPFSIPCPYCLRKMGARALRTHMPACPKKQVNHATN